jgi:tight adherence protein C
VLITVSIGFFLVMLSAVGGAGYYLWVRQTAAAGETAAPAEWNIEDATPVLLPDWLRILSELGAMLRTSGKERLKVRRDLAAAGYRQEIAVSALLGLKAAAAVVIPLFIGGLLLAANPSPAILLVVVLAGYLGYRLPDNVLRRKIERRKLKLNRGLPDLLDLLVIQVESGLSLEHALADTARDLRLAHPVLCE